jgi:ABC-type transport system substrate-binding protein
MPGHVPDLAPAYDLDAARRLLAEAGYPGGRGLPKVRVLVDKYLSTYMDPVLDHWALELGLEMEREFIEYTWHWSGGQEPHILGNGWLPDYLDPDSYLRVGIRSGLSPKLVPKWQDDTYDVLLERARRLMDQAERLTLYRQAEQKLVEETPIIPLIYNRAHYLARPWITNYRRGQDETLYLEEVIIEPH